MADIVQLTPEEVRESCHRVASSIATDLGGEEPIPEFDTRYPGVLESCLETPFQTYGGEDLYPTFNEKAATLFYLMIKNHPFANGNKRIAVISLMWFLLSNGLALGINYQDMYLFAKNVAMSSAEDKATTIQYILDILDERLISREDWFKAINDAAAKLRLEQGDQHPS